MRLPNMVSILLFTFTLLLLIPYIAAAALTQESAEIPHQINASDRIVIGTVSEIHTYDTYSVNTIMVKEWLYNPLPAKTIKVTNKLGTNLRVEDQAEFTLNENVLLMLKDSDPQKLLFTVSVGYPGKHPVSDRDAVINELKAQGKWKVEDQTGNKTNETETINKTEITSNQKENITENMTVTDGKEENTVTLGNQGRESNTTQKSNSIPFISSFWVLAVFLGVVLCVKTKKH